MFKIESYITPIILNYVAKYVKNIRPQDAQVSLWEGEVAFQNLDLQLDVLENELQLPFELLSGHIHELIIHVPWTKIASEPITITINTIEFVLKLKDQNAEPIIRTEKRKKMSKAEDAQGYMPGLVNKVANNISVNCHNIILKYVEEDIVVSMNVQLLNFSSADEDWKPAFIDFNPVKVLLRKLVKISDLTICLDRRNAAGKIDVCQEPILYRCSLEVRLIRKYNATTASCSSTTRIDVFSNSMDVNISSQQFPMAMRLFVLMMTLKEGKLKVNLDESGTSDHCMELDQRNMNNESYLTWAWNLLPSIFPEDILSEEVVEVKGHYFSTGLYIDNLKITLKSSELFSDLIVQTNRKIRYNPILKITLNGIYCETLMLGNRWFNMKCGISKMTMESLGAYAKNSPFNENIIFDTQTDNSSNYLNDSLFDSNCSERPTEGAKKFCTDWDTHFDEVTPESLKFRTPALSIDMVHFVDIPDNMLDVSSGNEIKLGTVLEKSLTRIIIASANVKYNSNLLNIIETIRELANSYDYPPYIEDRKESSLLKLTPPSTDDYDALMAHIPRRIYEVTLENVTVELYPKNRPNNESRINDQNIQKLGALQKNTLPFFILEVAKTHLSFTTPIYPNLLIHTTCQLPVKPKELVDACYETYTLKSADLKLSVSDKTGKLQLAYIPVIEFSYGILLQPHLWPTNDICKSKFNMNVESLRLIFNRPQQLVAIDIIKTILDYDCTMLNKFLNSSARNDMHDNNLPQLEFIFSHLDVYIVQFDDLTCSSGKLKSIRGYGRASRIIAETCSSCEEGNFLILNSPLDTSNYMEKTLIHWIVQLPRNYRDIKFPPIVSVKVESSVFINDPIFREFLNYEDNEMEDVIEADSIQLPETSVGNESETKSSRRSVTSERPVKRIIQPEETIHYSSDKVEKVEIEKLAKPSKDESPLQISDIFYLLKSMVFNIYVEQCSVLIPARSLVSMSQKISHFAVQSSNVDVVLFRLPIIKFNSSIPFDMNEYNTQFPISLLSSVWTKEKNMFPWTCAILEFTGSITEEGNDRLFLAPQKTNITIAINDKKKDDKNLALNLHIDTTPIVLNLSEGQVHILTDAIETLSRLTSFFNYSNHDSGNVKQQSPTIITVAENNSDIKEFLGINSESEVPHSNTETESNKTMSSNLSIWLQWTVTKFTINLEGVSETNSRRLAIEIEDFIASIDKQNVYFKLKTKVGTLHAQCFELNDKNDWIANDNLKMSVRPETTESKSIDTFLDLTVTMAETGNVFKKLGAQDKIRNLKQTLTEVMITSQAMDIHLDLELFANFAPIFLAFGSAGCTDTSRNKENITSVSDLPLIYIESKGITTYIPIETKNDWCNVLIFKIGSIKIAPNVENPLTRNPVRPDVYTKAAQMRILYTPGSKIEDRQYEVVFNDISAVTSNWSEVLKCMKENTGSFHNTNPAFEWNHQNKKISIEFNEIFKNFIVSITYAPCIVYKNILISGQSLELNCVTDFVANITTDQLVLLSTMLDILNSTSSHYNRKKLKVRMLQPVYIGNQILSRKESKNSSTTILEPQLKRSPTRIESNTKLNKMNRGDKHSAVVSLSSTKIRSENPNTDSGIASIGKYCIPSSNKPRRRQKSLSPNMDLNTIRKIPFEISVVTGIFLFKLYYTHRRKKAKDGQHIKSIPLVAMTLAQPSMLISQRIFEKSMKFSLFNMNISFGYNLHDKEALTNNNEFNNVVFETRQGHLDAAGIPPPLLSVKYKQEISKKIKIDVTIRRPVKIIFSHKILEKIIAVRIVLQEVYVAQCRRTLSAIRPIIRGTKVKLFKQLFGSADRINLSLDQLNLEYKRTRQYDFKASLSKLAFNLQIFERPEKVNFQIFMQSFLLSTDKLILLHPVTFKVNGVAVQENWSKLPIIWFRSKTNVIQIDIGPENIRHILEVQKSIQENFESFSKQWDHLEKEAAASNSETSLRSDSLTQIIVPSAIKSKKLSSKEEFYQDDLRAGAFQFVETYSEATLPLPYQIQIIMKEHGIVCWRYPQPRMISKLQLYPILIQSTSPVKIKCRLEYYNDSHGTFLPYCEFNLSEHKTEVIQLPERKITSNIWRVVILQSFISVDGQYFEESVSSGEDDENSNLIKIEDILEEEEKSDNDLKLNPKTLVACMRIDSSFNPTLIPKAQGMIEVGFMKINFQNQQQTKTYKMPHCLRHFKLSQTNTCNQTFASLCVTNMKLYGSILPENVSYINCDLNLQLQVLDYSVLNMISFLEETRIRVDVAVRKTLCVNTEIDAMRSNFGPPVMQTLLVSERLWTQMLRGTPKEVIIATRFVICNCTTVDLEFGQVGSKEQYILMPNDCCFYSFQNENLKQQIMFTFQSPNYECSPPISLNKESLKHFRIGNSVLIVKIEKLSSTQMCVFVRGQIEFISMVNEEFRIQCKYANPNSEETSTAMLTNDFLLEKNGRSSLFISCSKAMDYTLRIMLTKGARTGWSGEIPLRTNKNIPWLVKVPVGTDQEYRTFWVRVITEDLKDLKASDFLPQQHLVVIWPMFIVRSMLTNDMKFIETKTKTEYSLDGKGSSVELQVAGTHETEHELIFLKDFVLPLNEDKNKVVLSYKAIDWKQFFALDKKYHNIEKAAEELSKLLEIQWPCSKEEELRWDRELCAKEKTTPIFKCLPSNELSCTVMLDVSPWSLFINSTGLTVRIEDASENNFITVNSNNLTMLFMMKESFRISIEYGEVYASSLPIVLYGSLNGKSNKKNVHELPENGNVTIQICFSNRVTKFLLTSVKENGMRVIRLSPIFVVVNFSSYPLELFAFAVEQGKKTDRRTLLDISNAYGTGLPTTSIKTKNPKGLSIDEFLNINHEKGVDPERMAKKNFLFYISVKFDRKHEISCPVPLTKVFNRKCFSVYTNDKSLPLAAVMFENNKQFFVSIYDDPMPAVEIDNRTDLTLVVGQPEKGENTKSVRIVPEHEGNQFEWYQVLRPNSCLFYSPPAMYNHFPDVESHDCNLAFALLRENNYLFSKLNIGWSKPFRVDLNRMKFLNIPLFGDVKLIICDKHKVARVTIFYVAQQMEFSVKDLRTRLLNPNIMERKTDESVSFDQKTDDTDVIVEDQKKSADLIKANLSSECLKCAHASYEYGVPMKVHLLVRDVNFTMFVDNKQANATKKEILTLYVDDFVFKFESHTRKAEFVLSNIQIDNKIYSTGNYDFPVVLCPQIEYIRKSQSSCDFGNIAKLFDEYKNNATMYFSTKFYENTFEIQSIHCQIRPIRAYIEDTYINDFLDHLIECSPENVTYLPQEIVVKERCEAGLVLIPEDVISRTLCIWEPLKLKEIRIDPVSIMLSVHTCVRFYLALDHSPLDFSLYERKNIITLPWKLGHTLGMHYLSGALFGAGWVVGSLEILGSPSGLARSLTSGLRDFVSMPVQGLLRGPWGFLIGVTQGSASLLRNITAGTVNSVTKLAASFARNLDRLTLDDEHFQRTEALRRCRPQGVTQGFTQGLTGLGISLLGAVGGLARHPLEATSPVGVVTGVGKGIVGAFTKPISGAAELVALTGQGMLHSVGFNALPTQKHVKTEKILTSSADCKISCKLLPYMLNISTDQILFHYEATLVIGKTYNKVIICLTTQLFIIVKPDKDEVFQIVPVQRIEAVFDDIEDDLLNIKVLAPEALNEESESQYTKVRILNFLRDSTDHIPSLSSYSIEDLLDKRTNDGVEKKYDTNWSFYINTQVGSHLLNYLQLLNGSSSKI